jgi:hypothetical protein
MEGYRPRSFDCETGSHFHHGHVSGGPPIIPDSRFSQVRFGVSAIFFFRGPSQPQRGLSADSHTPLLLLVCPGPSSISHARLIAGSVSGHLWIDETTEYPESLCPMSALPPLERRGPSLRRALPLLPRSYGLMRRSRHLSPTSALASLVESAQVAISPCCSRDLLDVIPRILPRMLEPLPRRFR